MDHRRLRIGCEFVYHSQIPTPTVFQVRAATSPTVTVAGSAPVIDGEEWSLEPGSGSPVRPYADLYGNPCLRTVLPAGVSTLRYAAVATVPDAVDDADEAAPEVPVEDLPDDVLLYTLPSRYCLPDMLADEAWRQFADLAPGYKRVMAVCDHVQDHLTFRYGSSLPTSTALDVFTSGYGVCRDFTHLAISFCRALNIPARYAFGYLPEVDVAPDPSPMDFAAWMEVWLGDRWYTFDPRNNARRKGRVVIGRGRDASDVAMATTFGGPVLESMTVVAQEAAP